MTVKDLLKKEKGKYTNYELHYKERGKYCPFAFTSNRKLEQMKVISYSYLEKEGWAFDINLRFKGKRRDKTLIIVWEKI